MTPRQVERVKRKKAGKGSLGEEKDVGAASKEQVAGEKMLGFPSERGLGGRQGTLIEGRRGVRREETGGSPAQRLSKQWRKENQHHAPLRRQQLRSVKAKAAT